MSMYETFEMTKWHFRAKIKATGATSIRFKYIDNCSDEHNPCGTVRKTASYVLIGILGDDVFELVSKWHRRDHETVEAEVTRRYQFWFDQYMKEKKGATND